MAAGTGDAGGSSAGGSAQAEASRGSQHCLGRSSISLGWCQAQCPVLHSLLCFSTLLAVGAAPGLTMGPGGQGPRGPVSVGASLVPMGCLVPVMCTGGLPVAALCPAEPVVWPRTVVLWCHESGVAPMACSVISAQLPWGKGMWWCSCSSCSVLGAQSHQDKGIWRGHTSARCKERDRVEGTAVSRVASWHDRCHSL